MRLLLAFALGCAAAYFWTRKPSEEPAPFVWRDVERVDSV